MIIFYTCTNCCVLDTSFQSQILQTWKTMSDTGSSLQDQLTELYDHLLSTWHMQVGLGLFSAFIKLFQNSEERLDDWQEEMKEPNFWVMILCCCSSWRTLQQDQFGSGDECGRFLQLLTAAVELGSQWSVGWPHNPFLLSGEGGIPG